MVKNYYKTSRLYGSYEWRKKNTRHLSVYISIFIIFSNEKIFLSRLVSSISSTIKNGQLFVPVLEREISYQKFVKKI